MADRKPEFGAGSLHAVKLRTVAKCTPEELRGSCEREARAEFILARQALGLTQYELSVRLGVDRTTVENWERGATRVPSWAAKALERLAA